ncbi:MAG: HAMP domain-containing histidine kinase [Treponema sp.]|jgi:two-component system sensor histidine kinase HydH|nr:HAMP domain-containing histidine kinase [Treponema sp.]
MVNIKISSFIVTVAAWLLFSALTVLIVWETLDRARLIRDNDNERIFSTLFASMRTYENYGEAIESSELLRSRIEGIGVYGEAQESLYRWGEAPEFFDESILAESSGKSRFGRYTIPDKKSDRIKFVLRSDRTFVPSAPPEPSAGRTKAGEEFPPEKQASRRREGNSPGLGGKYFYIDIAHPAYRRTHTLLALAVPVWELAFLALAFYFRQLYLRNREYRERIESQKNLVVLGTAASTLAHEIKNPLLSIRLQTGILEKMLSGTGKGEGLGKEEGMGREEGVGKEELILINEEVDRLSALVYRVNDFLRDAPGNAVPLNPADLLEETSQRLCGRNIVTEDSVKESRVSIDPVRLRSVFENSIRNALEADGPEGEIKAVISREGGEIVIRIMDRGKGIEEKDKDRIFDPFYTTKSTGAGIGLSICKRFLEAAGGSIVLENRENGGAVAALKIPEEK